jgi:hypothetical protein
MFATGLRGRGISAGVYDGEQYPALGATINPQAKHTRKKGGYFYHLEAVHAIRSNPTERAAVIAALGATLFQGSPGAPAKIPYAEGFSPQAAVAYARKYAENPNPAYYDWSHREEGGDCTNFISQALLAGGWQYKETPISPLDRQSSTVWYYRWDDPSTSAWAWVNANMWASFAKRSGRVQKVKYLSDVGLGDIVQYSDPTGEEKQHSMIVTGFDAEGPLLSYHTKNILRMPLWKTFGSHKSWYAWRVVKVQH